MNKKLRLILCLVLLGAFGLAGSGSSPAYAQTGHSNLEPAMAGEMDQTPFLTREMGNSASLPLIILLIPLLAAAVVGFYGKDGNIRNLAAIAGTGLPFLALVVMCKPVISGYLVNGVFHKGIFARYCFLPGFDFTFRVDPANLLIALVTSLLWFSSTIYAADYMRVEGKEQRFAFFSLLTLMADLGVLLAGDFLTLFFFFEGLVIFPYALMLHRENEKAANGANNYLYFGSFSGLVLLLGILFLFKETGGVAMTALTPGIGQSLTGGSKALIAFLMIFGFGAKAGLFGLHIWMTTGYPNAPNAACSLSSGGMIKAGAYGIFRVVNLLFVPVGWQAADLIPQWATLHTLGYVVIWVGTVTMFMGVLGALISEDSNKMLGFHSVSQMGYIVMGLGCGAYMGAEGAMGVSGALYHIVNHALFKAVLFLGVGAVYFRTREVNMYHLGGLFKKMPVVGVCVFIAVMGISGIPLFNGFASKTLLHHSIVEAIGFSSGFAAAGEHAFGLKLCEIIFMLTAGGTFASNIKMFLLIFTGETPEKYQEVEPAPAAIRVGLVILASFIVFIGLFPNFILENFIGPALGYLNFNSASHAYHQLYNLHAPAGAARSTIPLLYPFGNAVHGWSAVMHNLMGAGVAVSLGGMYFILGMKYGWFHIHIPANFQFETHYKQVVRSFIWICRNSITPAGVALSKYMKKSGRVVYDGFAWFCNNPATAFGYGVNSFLSDFWKPGYKGFIWFCVSPSFKFGSWLEENFARLFVNLWQTLAYPKSLISWFERKIIPRWIYDKELWQYWIAKRYLEFCEIFRIFDPKVIDRAVNEVADNTLLAGEKSRVLHSNKLQLYIMLIGLSVAVFIGLGILLAH